MTRHRATLVALAALLACADPRARSGQREPPTPTLDPIVAELERMHASDPRAGAAIWVLARVALGQGQREQAIALLDELAALPDWDHVPRSDDFPGLAADPRFIAATTRIAARAPHCEHGPLALELSRADLRPEGLAWDARRSELLIGSMAEGRVFAVDERGGLRTLVDRDAGLLGVLGLDVDADDRLWLVDAALPELREPAPPDARAGLHVFSLAEGRRLATWAAPAGAELNDVIVTREGRPFVTDSLGGGLLSTPHESNARELTYLLAPGTLFAPNGLIASDSGDALYVSDFRGLARIELDTLTIARLDAPAGVATLAGIDGLERSGDTLIGIQNLLGAARVWALELDDAGLTIVAAELLDHDHPRQRVPTTGVVLEGPSPRFLYIGESQAPATGQGHAILSLPLAPRPSCRRVE